MTTEFTTMVTDQWNQFNDNGGYVKFMECKFQDPNWTSCLQEKWYVVVGLSLPFAIMGWLRQMLSHWSFYASVDAPEVEDSFTTGIYNVWTSWYIADSYINLAFVLNEGIIFPIITFLTGSAMIYYNQGNQMYTVFGALQIAATAFYMISNATNIVYDVINSVYLQSRYPMDKYVTILFGTPWNQFGQANFETVEILVYLQQLAFGNKRLALYAHAFMASAMLLHPITLSIGMYWFAQLPFQVILDLFVYPFLPQFDTPQIPWGEYLVAPKALN